MSKKADRLILTIYLLGFLIIAATIALLQPLADSPPLFGNPPDEHARFLVPWYIYEHGRIPTGFEEEIRIPSYGFSYGLYNVFPYIVQGFCMRFAGLFTESELILLYVARFVNVISGLCMAYVVYLLSKKLFADGRFRWCFCFGIMYLPQSLFMHTYVNTDSMCMLSTAMIVYGLVSAYREGFSRKNNLWLSGGIILCALSYYNAYGYILSSILLFLAYFLRRQDGKWHYEWKQMVKKGSFICVIVLLGISWWFIRSYVLYDGDMLGLATREKMAIQYASFEVNPLTMSTYENRGESIFQMLKETDFLEGAFIGFVAAYGSVTIFGNIWMYRLYKIFFALGLLGCIVLPGGRTGKESCGKPCGPAGGSRGSASGTAEPVLQRWQKIFFHVNMVFCILMPLILLIQYAYTTDFQNQGRYLLPAIVPLMYYTVRGLEKLFTLKKLPAWAASVGAAVSVLLPVVSTICMTYAVALPIYLKTGVLLN